MNPYSGEIREFPGNYPPVPSEDPKKNFVELKIGEVVSFNGLYFRIHRVNPAANQVILLGIPAPRGI